MNELYQVLDGLHLNVDFHNEKRLIDDGLLEIPENFNSAEAIYALVQRLKDEE